MSDVIVNRRPPKVGDKVKCIYLKADNNWKDHLPNKVYEISGVKYDSFLKDYIISFEGIHPFDISFGSKKVATLYRYYEIIKKVPEDFEI